MDGMKSRVPGIAVAEPNAGGCVRKWRKARGMIQKQLAAACGMSVAQLWSIETERNSPSVKTVARLASALGVTLAQLFDPPEKDVDTPRSGEHPKSTLKIAEADLVRILRPEGRAGDISKRDLKRLEADAAEAFRREYGRQTDIPTSLPLSFPITITEGGAEQLAHALRAHLDIGSAVLHNTLGLFETHGIRVLEMDALPAGTDAITYYSPKRRNYTVFLAGRLTDLPWRRDFAFLSEIGRAFIFASRGCEPFPDTAKSRRFAHHFAACFQQPEPAVRMAVYSLRVLPGDWTFELLLRLKDRFGVSAQSFNIRLKELSLISQAKHEAFKRRIAQYYAAHDNAEPPSNKDKPANRLGDLLALDQP